MLTPAVEGFGIYEWVARRVVDERFAAMSLDSFRRPPHSSILAHSERNATARGIIRMSRVGVERKRGDHCESRRMRDAGESTARTGRFPKTPDWPRPSRVARTALNDGRKCYPFRTHYPRAKVALTGVIRNNDAATTSLPMVHAAKRSNRYS
jgi:hypothetical protein